MSSFRFLKTTAFAILFELYAVSFAAANPTLVVDMRSGQVISADEATRPWHPASTTKLMTVYVALKMLKAGQVKLDTPLQGTRKAAAQKPSKIGIKPGQIITLDNALKILLVKSANDIAYVIAENLSGSSEAFVTRMNMEAQALGMSETYFTNPNGWHDSKQQTSARDLAVLARALYIEFPDYRDYWGIGSVQLGGRVYKNTNGLIGRYEGAIGMKTGFVCASGFNVVALAERGGQTLLTVVMGARSSSERTVQAAQLFDKGFQGGSTGYTLQSLPSSGQQNAVSIRGDVCNGRRGIPLSDEDYDGSIAGTPSQDAGGDKDSIYATMRGDQSAQPRRSSQTRYALGERNLGQPVPVYLGRAPGNTDPILYASLGKNENIGKNIAVEQSDEVKPSSRKGSKKQVKLRRSIVKDNTANLKLRPVGGVMSPEPETVDAPEPPTVRASAQTGIRTRTSNAQPRKLGAIEGKVKQPSLNKIGLVKTGTDMGAAKTSVPVTSFPQPPLKQGLIRPAPVAPKSAAIKLGSKAKAPVAVSDDE